MKNSLRRQLKSLGPGIITAALVFGPGSLTVNTRLGAGFEYGLLWVIPLAILLMIAYTRVTTKIGLAADRSLMEVIRERFGRAAAIFLGLGIFVITASFQAGNAVGAGVAFAGLIETPPTLWIVFFSAVAAGLLFFRSFYRILEKIMIGMVLIMFVAFVVTLLLSRPDPARLISGLVPGIPAGSETLAIALFASSFSVVAAFYQAYLVREKGWKKEDHDTAFAESRNGIILLGLLSAMVMICAAAVLHHRQIPVNTASDLGLALEPIFGPMATYAFMTGFFAASFSSLIGNATIGGALLADAFSRGVQLSSPAVRLLILGVIVIGSAVAVHFGALPLELIIFAQAFTIIIAPIVAVFILLIANDPGIMGNFVHTPESNILPVTGLCLLVLLAGYHIFSIIAA